MTFKQTKLHAGFYLLVMLCSYISLTVGAHAQTNYGSVVGTVTDSTGAAMVGASVTLTNTGTAAKQEAKTGSSGTYTFVNLNPGTYSVTVAQSGFQSYTRSDVDVQIGGTTRADFNLQVGDVLQSVTVTSAAPDLNTDSSTLGGVVEGERVVEAPLNGRNVNNLLNFIPGVVPGGGTGGSTIGNGGGSTTQAGVYTQNIAWGNYQIGGGFSGQSLFYVDGAESNIPVNNVNALVPTQDAVQEFRASTNNVSPEFGGFSGGVIEIATKSGTNRFHGSAYEYFRNTVLDANDWFSNHNGLARTPLHQNQFGVNVGGPIVKEKAFFFFSWEQEHQNAAYFSNNTVPTTAELNGDFSAIPQPIYDLSAPGDPQFSCNGVLNVICPDRIDPSASKLLAAESPAPLQAGIVSNYITTGSITGQQNQYNARGDYNLSKKDSLFARYTYWNPHNLGSDPFKNRTGPAASGDVTHEAVLGENHTFNSTTLAEVRLSWLWNYNYSIALSNGADLSQFGPGYAAMQNNLGDRFGPNSLPYLILPGYSIGALNGAFYWISGGYSISGSVTKTLGRHLLKVGGTARQAIWTDRSTNYGIGIISDPSFTASPSNPDSGNTLASFLLGTPLFDYYYAVLGTHAFLHSYAFFANDTFQVSRKLTLTAGLRWEQPGSYSERNDLDTELLPNALSPLGSIVNPVTGMQQTLRGNLALVHSQQYPSRREEDLHWRLFSPRVGLAYRVFDSTVIHAGYGISYLPAEMTADGPGGSATNSAATLNFNVAGNAPSFTVSNPFPSGFILPSGRDPQGLNALLGQSIYARTPSQPYGYVQQFNFGIERSLGPKTAFSVAYAGNKGTHLVISSGGTGTGLNLNQLPDQYHSLGNSLLDEVPNPFYGEIASGPLSGPTVLEGYMLQPFPQYQTVAQVTPRSGNSTYNALQATLKRHFNHGGTLGAAYTFSKLISDTDNTSSFQDGQGSVGNVQDYTNINGKAISLQSYPNNLVINYGIDIPFGKGSSFYPDAGRSATAMLGGWRADGITTFLSGTPVALIAAPNALNQYFGAGSIRPNLVPGCQRKLSGSRESRVTRWFNTDCFTQPANFSFGNESRVDPQLRSDGIRNFDFSLTKIFSLSEKSKIQFTTQFFNIFNRPQFALPDGIMTDPTYGQVSSEANTPRDIQFALRYTF
jgi:hypothetical protein